MLALPLHPTLAIIVQLPRFLLIGTLNSLCTQTGQRTGNQQPKAGEKLILVLKGRKGVMKVSELIQRVMKIGELFRIIHMLLKRGMYRTCTFLSMPRRIHKLNMTCKLLTFLLVCRLQILLITVLICFPVRLPRTRPCIVFLALDKTAVSTLRISLSSQHHSNSRTITPGLIL